MNKLKMFSKIDNTAREFITLNRNAVNEYNENVLSKVLRIGWIIVLIPLIAVPFSKTKSEIILVYSLLFAYFFVMYYLFKLINLKNYVNFGLYLSSSVLLVFSIYLSVFHSPQMRATFLLVGLVLTPIGFIDQPRRLKIFLL